MKLRFLAGHYEGRIVDLSQSGLTIGRGTDNDLILKEEGMSRHHCKLSFISDNWVVEDLNSTNGVRVNGARISGAQSLKPGDTITLGTQQLLITDGVEELSEEMLQLVKNRSDEKKIDSAGINLQEHANPFNEDESLPWGRIAVVILLLGVFVWLLIITFVKPKQPIRDEKTTVEQTEQQEDLISPPAPKDNLQKDLLDNLEEEPEDEFSEVHPDNDVNPPVQDDSDINQIFNNASLVKDDNVKSSTAVENQTSVPSSRAVPPAFVIQSKPAGATILFDDVEQGLTPKVFKEIKEGNHRITLKLDGYEDIHRRFSYPDEIPDNMYSFRLKAGVIKITSEPSGASVWNGPQMLGNTPLLLTTYPEGKYTFNIYSYAFETENLEIDTSPYKTVEKHVDLVSSLGTLELSTTPAGCTLNLNGTNMGMTKKGLSKIQSEPLVIKNLKPGEYTALVSHPNGKNQSTTIKINKGKTTRQAVPLWVIDTKLILIDDSVKYGMAIEKSSYGDVALQEDTTPDSIKRYLKPQISRILNVDSKEAMEYLQNFTGLKEDNPATDNATPRYVKPVSFKTADLNKLIQQKGIKKVKKEVTGKPVILYGKPAKVDEEAEKYTLQFGAYITCDFAKTDIDEITMIQIKSGKLENLKVKGQAIGFIGNSLLVRNCKIIE